MLGAIVLAAAAASALAPLPLPDGTGGIGFDDLGFSSALHRVLVPSGRTGRLNLVDPKTLAVTSIPGFTSSAPHAGGHGDGTTSADFGHGVLFASDRDAKIVAVIDPESKAIVAKATLGAGPDYVRWVEPLSEVWVTEPRRKAIERFKLEDGPPPKLTLAGTISFADGPESLVIDAAHGRAYTHTWQNTTMVVDLASGKQVASWRNGCEGSRGVALDPARGLLFVGCEEGKAVALDLAHDGKIVGTAKSGSGVDIIAYSPALHHLYLPGGDSATMAILDVGDGGALKVLATVPTAKSAHCVTADDDGHAYVCDPGGGQLLVYTDR